MVKCDIKSYQYINAGEGLILTAVHNKAFVRIYFITNEGISRHADMDNLNDCLTGLKQFSRDAVFFFKKRAISVGYMFLDTNPESEIIEAVKDDILQWIQLWKNR